MKIEWLGHSSIKIKSGTKIIYIDPYSGDYSKAEKADIILITHSHHDHFSKEKIEQLMTDETEIVGPADVAKLIDAKALSNNQSIDIKGINITAVSAYNVSKNNHQKGDGNGYVFELEGKKIYHAGDTDFIPEMNIVEAEICFLPVGGTYTMDADEAVSAALVIIPDIAIPIHYGEIVGHKEDAIHFKEEVERESEIEVKILDINEQLEV